MTEYIFPIVNVLGSLCSTFSFLTLRKKGAGKWNWTNLALTILLLITAILAFAYIRSHDPERNARVFYNRYKDLSFSRDFSDDKLRAVVMDGMIVLRKIGLEKTDPVVYRTIMKKFLVVTEAPFIKEDYVALGRMIFGACGSISGDLYSNVLGALLNWAKITEKV